MVGAVMPESRVDDAGEHQTEVRFALLPRHVEEFLQLFEIAERIGEPPYVFDCADIKITRISKEVDHMGQSSVFADFEIETVAGLDRPCNLGGIAQAEHDLRRQFEI